jgi:hypothetical protein
MLHVSEQSWQRQCALRDVGSELGHVLPQRHPELSRRISAFVLGTPVQQSTQPRWDDLCDVFFSHDTS